MLQPDGAGFAAYLEGEPVDAELRGARVTGSRLGGLGGPGGPGVDQLAAPGPGPRRPGRGRGRPGHRHRGVSGRRPQDFPHRLADGPGRPADQPAGPPSSRRGSRPKRPRWLLGTTPTRPGPSLPSGRRRTRSSWTPTTHGVPPSRSTGSWSWPGRIFGLASVVRAERESHPNRCPTLRCSDRPVYPTWLRSPALPPARQCHSLPRLRLAR